MNNKYQLQVGEDEKIHLNALDALFGKESRRFLSTIPIQSNAYVADIGCGAGQLACWLAKEIVPNGRVSAIDSNPEQLILAKKNADSLKITNITFEEASITDLSKFENQFDAIYCRWVLTHIENLDLALHNMINSIKSGGILACEEPTSLDDSVVVFPEINAFRKVFGYIRKLLQLNNCDPNVGFRIYQIAKDYKELETHIKISQRALDNLDEKNNYAKQLGTLLASIKPSLLKNNIDSLANINALEHELSTLSISDDTIILATRMIQLTAKKN